MKKFHQRHFSRRLLIPFFVFITCLICSLQSAANPTDSIGYSGATSFCQGQSLLLTANYAPSGSSFQWQVSFNGGGAWNNIGTNQPTFTATTTGLYTVIVTTGGVPTMYPAVNVTVNPKPVAAFSFNPNNNCSSTPVSFTNTSSGAVSYSWDFGDPVSGTDNFSSQQNPTHHFIGSYQGGTQSFNVTLIATSSAGCKDTVRQVVTTSSPSTLLGGTGFTIYNGLPYFTQCVSSSSSFTLSNLSNSSNSSYTIIWGDGSPDFTTTSFSTVSHTYTIGTHNLLFIVTGGSGCTDTATYVVFVGGNPQVGMGNPGNTIICSGTSLTFPITTTSNNPPGTQYIIRYNDGSPNTILFHPAPASITHTFNTGSCGVTSSGHQNSFEIKIEATNPCGISGSGADAIYVSQKIVPQFTIQPSDTVCVNKQVTLTNTSQNGFGVSGLGICIPPKGVWQISPSTGWSITSGTLGNDFNSMDPTLWISGSTTLNLNFSVPGTYSIKLKTGNSLVCGVDSIVKTICVNIAPVAAFSISGSQGCAPYDVSTTNNSNTPGCGSNTYQWTVSYANPAGCSPSSSNYIFLNGTNAASAAPQFQFINPGVYTITLVTRNSAGTCISAPVSQAITVKAKASVTINAPSGICQNTSINPTATVNNCYSVTSATYAWSFPGGVPSSSTLSIPGSVLYSGTGTQNITLAVTNECGVTTIPHTINITPAPDVTVPANLQICAGTATGTLAFSSSIAGTTYSWTNSNPAIGLAASGSGTIPSFTATNTGNNPITGVIAVTPSTGCQGPSSSFSITVNPRPSLPAVTSPVIYCVNSVASPLNATASGSNTLTWYNNPALTGGFQVAPTPSTSVPGTFIWYVTQTNSFSCASGPATITVTIHPAISGNTIASDQTICAGAVPVPLSGLTVTGGSGSYTYQWQSSSDGVTWNNISGATASGYAPASINASIQYRRIIISSSCTDTSNVVIITVQGSLTGVDISSSQTICAGTAPALLIGQAPSGGNNSFSFQWESSVNNINWNTIAGATSADYQPSVLTQTTYYRRKTSSGSCSSYSSSLTISVNPIPVITNLNDRIYCNNTNVSNIVFSSIPSSNVSYSWTNDNPAIGLGASGNGNPPGFAAANTSNPKVPVEGNIIVTPVYTNNSISCTGNPGNFKIIVLPTISIAPVPDTSLCTGLTMPAYTPFNDAASFTGSSVTYNWTVSGTGTTLINGNGTVIPGYSVSNPGTTDLIVAISITPVYHYNSTACNGTTETYTVTIKPGTAAANAGNDIALCNLDTYIMQAILPPGTNGVWTQIAGAAAGIVNNTSPTTQINSLNAGNTYSFVWTLSGFASCPNTKDTIAIRVDPEVINTIDNTPQTICAGQSVTINGNPPSGGNGTYQYQWQSSNDNSSWADIPGATSSSLSITLPQTQYVRRIVRSLPCFTESISTLITVQPAITNNSIAANQQICINTAAATLTGTVPTGGNNTFSYQWQSSPDGIVWADIAGAVAQNYSPGILTMTTYYRRLVATSLCAGPQASASNSISVTVRPDAKALFNPTTQYGCAPFTITPAIINLSLLPAVNGSYSWYANNNFIGNGSSFPGYTILQSWDSITIKLVAVSLYGCKNDSISYKFYTYPVPDPSFTLSDTVGCGPLTVTATNTTPNASQFSYLWDFGNGITSAAVQPSPVIFQPNPNYRDTFYLVKLKVFSPCDTIIVSEYVHVKSKPRALFTPSETVGCSPMNVIFNNSSLGLNVTYTWDFGDGSSPVTTNATGTISHTYYTGIRDTFFVKLTAVNECGRDSLVYSLVVSPNIIHLDFAVNGNEQSGCNPHAVHFINNSSGASAFTWNFGDGTIINTSSNIDTVLHSFLVPGTYVVTLNATNGCSDTTSTETVVVYPKPVARFTINQYRVCLGDSVRFTNLSDNATSYLWQFGDGSVSVLPNPVHTYSVAGIYNVKLIAYRFNPGGSICVDSVSHSVEVVTTLPGWFTASDTAATCAPLTVQFSNMNVPSISAQWDFGDGTSGAGNVISHTYTTAGIYLVTLTVVVPGGCTYITTRQITLAGPSGTFSYTHGYLCNDRAAAFQVNASNTDSLIFDFGDGITLTTTNNLVFHSYVNGGVYIPSVRLKNTTGCVVPLIGTDTIKVDKIKAGFIPVIQRNCGNTVVSFTDTSLAFFGKLSASWDFGDGTSGSGFTISHTYLASGTYPVRLIVIGNSGCSDTITKQLNIHVNNIPVASIQTPSFGCVDQKTTFNGSIQSTDAINIIHWTLSNGATGTSNPFSYTFTQPGNYTVQLIAGTVNGCYDTVTQSITVNVSPTAHVNNDLYICRGNSVQLNTVGSGIAQFAWSPVQGLSCINCANPVASPVATTAYVLQATNTVGCSVYDTVVVTVIQPLQLNVSPDDSICIGQSSQLVASGASSYKWSPAIGLSNTTISNPLATPSATTIYRVVGFDGYNCFTDTAFVMVAVGPYPTVSLGPDLVLATGTLHPLNSTITNGPIRNWQWSPVTDLSCSTCPLPIAHIRDNISYTVKATTPYGCSASDTISIKVFCENAQVFVPNAFTPDGDGINDKLLVRGKGIASVRTFRIFNRWGEIVFERSNFPPNDPGYGWDGRVKGVVGPPEVYVYTADVICENGTTHTYKGNVSLLK